MKLLSLFVAVLIIAAASIFAFAQASSFPVPSSCNAEGHANTFPVNTEKPTFVRAVPYGKRYTAGQGLDNFTILHLYGTPYQMGFAQGTLMKEEVNSIIPAFNQYLVAEIEKALPTFPPAIAELVIKYGAPVLLDLTLDFTKDFTPQHYIDEMQGMADASGQDLKTIWRLNLFPEFIRAACTITLSTGKSNPLGSVQHLRALDFGVHNPIKDWAQITVYHFDGSDGTGNKYEVANFGWTLLIGSLTGISSSTVGLGEKVWDNHPKDIISATGKPWMFIDRDVLAQASSVPEALAMIQNSNRTCAIHLGLGDTKTGEIRGLEIAGHFFQTFNDTSLNYTGHPIIPDVFYWNKHAQPSSDACLADLLLQYYGNITAYNLAIEVSPKSTTGNFHAVTFDYGNLQAYFANSRKTYDTNGDLNAYFRQYTFVDVKALFEEKQ